MEFKPPYSQKGECSFLRKEYYRKQGVYLIREEDEIIYIGMSISCIYSTFYRHFQNLNDPHFNRTVYPKQGLKAVIVKTDSPEIKEKELIKLFKPRDNRQRYETFTFDYTGCWWVEEFKRMELIQIPF